MIISESIDKFLKSRIGNVHSIIDLEHIEGSQYNVGFISCYQVSTNPPVFKLEDIKMNLKSEIRDQKIDNILNFGMKIDDFDVEDIIYTEDQKSKLEKLRQSRANVASRLSVLNKTIKEYSESFHIGQKIWYKNTPGIITFKHSESPKGPIPITKWSVKVKDTEFRYVKGTVLLKRESVDLSNVKIDTELNKLSTENLLKLFKKKRYKGVGNIKIKKILQEREHVQINEPKIIIVNK